MSFSPKIILISIAIEILQKSGIADPFREVLIALQEGQLIAEGKIRNHPDKMLPARWGQFDPIWWRDLAISDTSEVEVFLRNNLIYFRNSTHFDDFKSGRISHIPL